uniref:Uncharacterized protein n=1 Tax=Timema douglasi TaxID=61478 RepID=A0A7R8VNV4_TIMDO|nr:unnamed protein product [Timema douglasi]
MVSLQAGTATKHDTKESSDTESADHGSDQTSKPKMNLAYIFNKKDKIADDSEGLKDITTGRGTPLTIQAKQGDVVYAELDLQQGNQPRSVVRKEDDKTEYAEIIHTKTPGEESK